MNHRITRNGGQLECAICGAEYPIGQSLFAQHQECKVATFAANLPALVEMLRADDVLTTQLAESNSDRLDKSNRIHGHALENLETCIDACSVGLQNLSKRVDGHHISMAALEEHIVKQDAIIAALTDLASRAKWAEEETPAPFRAQEQEPHSATGQVVARYQQCVHRILAMFDGDPLGEHPAHYLIERLEALLDRGLIGPTSEPRWDIPEDLLERLRRWSIGDGGAVTIVGKLQRALKDRPDGWIPVGERLPEATDIVEFCDVTRSRFIGDYTDPYWDAPDDEGDSHFISEVTHWKPLCPGPKEG